jgi:hypothetical protein
MKTQTIIHIWAVILMLGYSFTAMFAVGAFLVWYSTGKPGPLAFCLLWLTGYCLSCFAAAKTKGGRP